MKIWVVILVDDQWPEEAPLIAAGVSESAAKGALIPLMLERWPDEWPEGLDAGNIRVLAARSELSIFLEEVEVAT